jgi:GrpB-like predicted nucleotidyltransferase (UPF0157 family)
MIAVGPDPAWPEQYRDEAEVLSLRFSAAMIDVQHIGSTSVPGLIAKPVIDILLVVHDLAQVDAQADELRRAGYEYLGEHGMPGRRYLRRVDAAGRHTHHIHVFAQGSSHIRRHLAVRDYLRAHPAERDAYAAVKQTLMGQVGRDRKRYQSGKDAFVEQLEVRALDWMPADR